MSKAVLTNVDWSNDIANAFREASTDKDLKVHVKEAANSLGTKMRCFNATYTAGNEAISLLKLLKQFEKRVGLEPASVLYLGHGPANAKVTLEITFIGVAMVIYYPL